MNSQSFEARLQEPFEPSDVKWRIQQSGVSNGRVWMKVIPYITGRAIQKRLDDVFGIFGWSVTQEETAGRDGFVCTISIFSNGIWIKKQDVAPKTDIEPLKGGASGALKRAGALLGIGRYLYQLDACFANCVPCDDRRKAVYNYAKVKDKYAKNSTTEYGVDWQSPELPAWAMPGIDAENFSKAILESDNPASALQAFDDAYRWANSFSRTDLMASFKTDRDSVLEKLQSEAFNDVAQRLDNVDKWLDKSIKSLNLVANVGAVEKVGDRIRVELAEKCQYQQFDTKPLAEKLKTAIKERLNLLSQKEA